MSRRKPPPPPIPERLGVAVRRPSDPRPVTVELSVEDACQAVVLLDFAAAVYETIPPLSQFDVHTGLAARGVAKSVERARGVILAAIAEVVDPARLPLTP